MALIRFDGFGLSSSFPPGWTAGSGTIQTASPRFAGRRYGQAATLANSYVSFTAVSEIYVGFAVNFTGTAPSGGNVALYGDAGATSHLSLTVNSSGNLRLLRGGTELLISESAGFTNAWHFIEVRATIDNSTGICQVRVDGATSPLFDFSGDTRNGGTNTTIDRVRFASSGSNSTVRFTDVYLLDTSGSAPLNTWLGDLRVDALAPSGAGNSTGWTPSAGSNWDCVEEVPEATADYVSATDSGTEDLYALADMDTTVADVLAVKVQHYAQKSDAGASSIVPVLRYSGTDYDGDSVALATSWAKTDQTWTTNPGTSEAWTRSQVDALEAGMKVA